MVKKRRYEVKTEARRRAREVIGTVPRTKLIPDKRRKEAKHKIDLRTET